MLFPIKIVYFVLSFVEKKTNVRCFSSVILYYYGARQTEIKKNNIYYFKTKNYFKKNVCFNITLLHTIFCFGMLANFK